MSYPPPRPSSTPISAESQNENGHASSQQSMPQQGQGQSPLDWANFMSFPTPPVPNAGPAGNGMRQNQGYSTNGQHSQNGQGGQMEHGGQQGQSNDHNHGNSEEYSAFAQGIAMSRPSQSSIHFQQPFPHRTSSSSGAGLQAQSFAQPSQLSPNTQNSQVGNNANAGPSRSPVKGKGKSIAPPPPHNLSDGQQDNDNGLTLDPDAFSRDIRFQVPQFLSNQMGGAPTFPPGGEAWSGFGANMFSNDASNGNGNNMSQQLTPGSMFSNAFGLNMDSSHGQYGNEASGGGRNVLEGLSGFMGDGAWEGWDKDVSNVNGGTGLTPGNNGNGNNSVNNTNNSNMASTTFYINPNPSPNILAQRQASHQAQHPQATPMDHRTSLQQQQQRSNGPSLNVSTNGSSHGNSSLQSPRSTSNPHPGFNPSPRKSSGMQQQQQQQQQQQHRNSASTLPSPHSAASSTIPTSALFPQQSSQGVPGAFYAPSMSTPTNVTQASASTINIASSSTQPYAPPANTQALLSGPSLPAGMAGPSLTDGPGLYSTTGFDMVGVLSRVAGRKDPKTVLGPVDLSCSFLVVDVRRYDSPIVYASPTFMALTGYELPQILGRNCRFLQSPDGEVVKGSKRKYTDNVAVAHLKRMLNAGKECQASLINYRRGGIPFINLVTVVPIPWEGTDIVYHVGFQVDLVEQPNAILRNMRDGSYQVNYTVANPPQPTMRPSGREGGLGLSPEIIEIMGPRVNLPGFGVGEEGGKMEWLKMVLENADDFVHVLSLKGLFQYVSPSVRRVLEYEPEDLLNKNISDICHPSDIVPLMRELKDSTHANADGSSSRKVHLVFRIRRKSSGYVWIECKGRLHVEPGKGRKAVILSGRALSVPVLPWEQVSRNGGLAETEAWLKLSFDGLILHATSTITTLTGKSVEDVVGQSVFSLLPGNEDGPPSDQDRSSASAHLLSALRTASSHQMRSAVTLRLQMILGHSIYDTTFVVYPPRTSEINGLRGEPERSISPSSEDSRPTSSSSSFVSGTKPSSLIIQVKVNSAAPVKAIVHGGSTNMFEELETTRGTSWQYELHQLRLLNRRLKEDISGAKARGKAGKGKKRKAEGGGGNGDGVMGPPRDVMGNGPIGSRPAEHFSAAPRHQLAPGFGLVVPGMSPYYS